jgi:RNA polymerase sigma factor (sigma-70 family)
VRSVGQGNLGGRTGTWRRSRPKTSAAGRPTDAQVTGAIRERDESGLHTAQLTDAQVTGAIRDRDESGLHTAQLTDAQVMEAIGERDESGLRAAVAKYGGLVHGRALQILRQPMLAEEVAQDTFMSLWLKPGRFDPNRGTLPAFLVAVARNKAIDVVRHEQVIRSKESLAARTARWLEPSIPADPGEKEDGIGLRSSLSRLPRLKREAVFLAYFRGLTYREVSRILGVPEGTAKTRIRDALISLRSSMVEEWRP